MANCGFLQKKANQEKQGKNNEHTVKADAQAVSALKNVRSTHL
jgi:hypothetical protein